MTKMKWIILMAIISALMVPEFLAADECIFLTSQNEHDYYYNTQSLRHEGDVVRFLLWGDKCETEILGEVEIDCAKKMVRYQDPVDPEKFLEWQDVQPGSFEEALMKKMCQ
ncbi:MAG: hypothetical protein NTW95_14390 [Candidatus Aminicenantes bacterium]|nr:hypothetical protein [Candidatus Aminicenantes bacterium]